MAGDQDVVVIEDDAFITIDGDEDLDHDGDIEIICSGKHINEIDEPITFYWKLNFPATVSFKFCRTRRLRDDSIQSRLANFVTDEARVSVYHLILSRQYRT
ncbi:hypothetical protein ONS95_002638 [Cadophora gregata]|uniref:uncharacterized protein n=1 Tax=Cadophora gregata TaxID=51156 RepID=UPI0026DD0376|nr:uncharacterized protein ONS95_002638 [Cadophora gregata]KAK0109971.1 hypothetical protein ONS95_002638 [Cadophora gregata]